MTIMSKSSTAFTAKPPQPKSPGRQPKGGSAWLQYLGLAVLVIAVVGGMIGWHYYDSHRNPFLGDSPAPTINARTAPGPAPEGMVWIPGGEFYMGIDEDIPGGEGAQDYYADARHVHKIYVDGFWMDKTEVTNEAFAKFVAATGYQTVAEKQPDPKQFRDVPADKLKPFSLVFKKPEEKVRNVHLAHQENLWWDVRYGASWKNPEGPGSDIKGKDNYPVVHICWDDAVAYCKWAGKRLPTEAEWEFAARGGLDRKEYVWGDRLKDELPLLLEPVDQTDTILIVDDPSCIKPGDLIGIGAEAVKVVTKEGRKLTVTRGATYGKTATKATNHSASSKLSIWNVADDGIKWIGKWKCNAWQGDFPNENKNEDGFEGLAPVAQYSPNGYGLYDMAGNAWEWCSDYYQADYYRRSDMRNPKGPASSFDPAEPDMQQPKHVQRGGSFLCCDNYCRRYIPGARGKGEASSAANHVGFRCVQDHGATASGK
jgi:formylglycine-generating enzyme required for sulfatase activity